MFTGQAASSVGPFSFSICFPFNLGPRTRKVPPMVTEDAEMIIARYYKFFCSSCGRQYATKVSPVVLGTGRRRCKSCGEIFSDGCKEWPELSGPDKFRYFFPTTVLAFLIAAILIALITMLIFHDDVLGGLGMATFVFLFIMLPWLPYRVLQWRRVPVSRERFARRSVFGDTDEFVLST